MSRIIHIKKQEKIVITLSRQRGQAMRWSLFSHFMQDRLFALGLSAAGIFCHGVNPE